MMGQIHSRVKSGLLALCAALLMLGAAQPAFAQGSAPNDGVITGDEAATLGNAPESAMSGEVVAGDTEAPSADGAYVPMAPTEGKGMPTAKGFGFQDQYSKDGEYALWMHNIILMPVITAISLLVLALLVWVVIRYNRKSNPVPSKTTHNTLVEVIWTIVPVIILVIIAVPSITLLARQYENPPEDAITIKATGYQWYWGYTYPDHGDLEIISNMLSDADAIANGEPAQLAVDNRMVVPVGVPLRIQTTAADVIHAFAVPALWFKMDAVPGRLNERMLTIEEPGVYYGQCSELCGARHAYMPIAVEALPLDKFNAWVLSKGGTLPSAKQAGATARPLGQETGVEVPKGSDAADNTVPAP